MGTLWRGHKGKWVAPWSRSSFAASTLEFPANFWRTELPPANVARKKKSSQSGYVERKHDLGTSHHFLERGER